MNNENEEIFVGCFVERGGCGCITAKSELKNDKCPHCEAPSDTLVEIDPYE